MNDQVLEFINSFKIPANTPLVRIYTQGGCYAFYTLLKRIFPDAVPFKVVDKSGHTFHILSKIGDSFYDVRGEVIEKDLTAEGCKILSMSEDDILEAEQFRCPVIQPAEPIDYEETVQRCKKDKISSLINSARKFLDKAFLYASIAFVIPGYQKMINSSTPKMSAETFVWGTIPLVIILYTLCCTLCFFMLKDTDFKWSYVLVDGAQITFKAIVTLGMLLYLDAKIYLAVAVPYLLIEFALAALSSHFETFTTGSTLIKQLPSGKAINVGNQ